MEEEEAQYNEEEQEEGNEEGEEEIDESCGRVDNPVGDDTIEKTLYDDEGNEVSFVFDKFYMVSNVKKT